MTQGVIFDVDGTLVDSNDAHARAWAEALAEQGHNFSVRQIRPLIGMGGDKILPRLTGLDDESPEGERIKRRRGEIFKDRYLAQIQPQPGARALLLALRERGLKLTVASSAQRGELDGLLARIPAEGLFCGMSSSDDADRSKPDPDIVHAALGQLGLPAAQVIMVGDTPYDISAAVRAEVRPIVVRCGGSVEQDLRTAAGVFNDPADLLAHLDEVLRPLRPGPERAD